MRKLVLCLFLFIMCFNVCVFAEEETPENNEEEKIEEVVVDPLGLEAESAILIDAKTGMVLYEKNAYNQMYPASITKILTAYLVCEHLDLNTELICSNEAIFGFDRASSHIALDVGEVVSVEDLLNAMMLESANDAANVLAEGVGGTLERFTDIMNDTVESLGLTGTHFNNAHGMPDENHYTTAYDMAMITRKAIRNDNVKQLLRKQSYQMAPTNLQSETRYFNQNHQMLTSGPYHYDYATGGKLGYTRYAKYTSVTTASKDNMDLIVVVLGCDEADMRYRDTTKLFEYGFNHYKTVKVKSSDIENVEVIVKDGRQAIAKATFSIDVDFNVLLSMDSDESLLTTDVITTNERSVDNVSAYVVLYLNGNEIGRVEMNREIEMYDTSFSGSTLPMIKFVFDCISLVVLVMFIGIHFIYKLRNNKFIPE